ncbi:MAG: SusD/RagB family nutrient-binding outer membrane lipoprotein, partial [Eudoraea sp.]|nr:SusD/RagB family nutrient-binding outer membrane lipoprotein [Eudoraea sp.]MBT8221710.1 SusD/RagB family nutrient-binding outer membrane lipoprotein [Eudoraea sp.]NNJ41105.1 SusD/RagB family nutrient-binding outer membrane lipoprotein [Eudoraea sp.]
MKRVLKYITVVFIAGGFFQSCETTELDLRVSPNDLASDQADPNLLLNSIQLAYASNMDDLNDLGAEVTRIDYMFGRDYFNNYSGATLNGVWSRTYSSGGTIPGDFVSAGIWTNVDALIAINEASDIDYSFHIGVGQALKAHMLMLITDYIGGAVLTQAAQPAEFPAPAFDDGPTVYAGALALLDEAESLLSGAPEIPGVTDLFYGGDTDQWIKLVETLRLKAYQTTNNVAGFNQVIARNNFISDNDDDFEFQYGTSELQPDTRHPDFAADYT